ncbi:MAG TPA: sugar phosphate isomerase/epimerase family protein [Anaerolineales bacterium]|nr:sugar phosphate isomerase/epimerase family protein [Anaerolineales bacterium]
MIEPVPFPIGVCTWTFGDLPLAEIARKTASLGLDGVELLGDLSRYSAREAKDILASAGLEIFSLTPTDADLAHPDETIRGQGVDYYLQLLDFAAELGRPLVSCHGLVGRVAALTSMDQEMALLASSVHQIAKAAQERGLRVVFEVLNRYETHTIHTCQQAVKFIDGLAVANMGVLLDAYHMNIEESQPIKAIQEAGRLLWLYHAADSNRQAIGRGHTDFEGQLNALRSAAYTGPIILECTAPGPNPFTPIKDNDSFVWLEMYLAESLTWLQKIFSKPVYGE